MYPGKGWDAYEKIIRLLGEQRFTGSCDDLEFLRALAFVEEAPVLAPRGKEYFVARYINGDEDGARPILRSALLEQPEAAAIVQLLAGLGVVPRTRAEVVLRSQGFGQNLTERALGQLLALLNRVEAIRYSKRDGEFEVLVNTAATPKAPSSIFIAPESPYANRTWLRRLLEECDDFIYWLDKHFLPVALEAVWEATQLARVSEVRILSLALPENCSKKAHRAYTDLQTELKAKSIRLEWRLIDSRRLRSTHDRWIIGRSSARNVPNVNAIMSGQHSEMNISEQGQTLRHLFERYWDDADPHRVQTRSAA